MQDIFPQGDAPSIDPFIPCAATSIEENLTIVLYGVKEAFLHYVDNQGAIDSNDFAPNDFTSHVHHQFSKGETPIRVKEYSPKVFSKLRKMWGIDTKDLSYDFNLPTLQVQANSMSILDDTGAIKGTNIPSNSKKYIAETVNQRDIHCFFNFLRVYATYMVENPNTFLLKAIGVFKCSTNILTHNYVILMENPEYINDKLPYVCNRIYYLQGIKVPIVPPPKDNLVSPSRPVFCMDKNKDRSFRFGDEHKDIIQILKSDVDFLKSNGMILYCLIISVGNVVVDEGVDDNEIENLKRGLSKSDFGEWNLLGGISNFWRKFGKREQVSTSLNIFTRKQESMPVADPNYYSERFLEMISTIITS